MRIFNVLKLKNNYFHLCRPYFPFFFFLFLFNQPRNSRVELKSIRIDEPKFSFSSILNVESPLYLYFCLNLLAASLTLWREDKSSCSVSQNVFSRSLCILATASSAFLISLHARITLHPWNARDLAVSKPLKNFRGLSKNCELPNFCARGFIAGGEKLRVRRIDLAQVWNYKFPGFHVASKLQKRSRNIED